MLSFFSQFFFLALFDLFLEYLTKPNNILFREAYRRIVESCAFNSIRLTKLVEFRPILP